MSYKIEITENSVSIKTQQELFDADGNPAGLGPSHRRSIGVADFAEDRSNITDADREKYKIKVNQVVQDAIGKPLADAHADRDWETVSIK